jgi:hypothetical protein
MQRMIDVGLFELHPQLGDKKHWDKWAKRVLSLRQSFDDSQDIPTTTHIEICRAVFISEACFGARWTIPLAAMLLALKHRRKNDPITVHELETKFTSK